MRSLPRVWRVAIPFVAGCICMFAGDWVSTPIVAYVLIMAGLGLVLDGLLALLPTNGGLWANRQ